MTEKEKKHNHLMATSWSYAIKEHIKTGLESPRHIGSYLIKME